MEDEVEGASICPNFICCTPFQERAFTRALMRRDISTNQEEAMYNIMSPVGYRGPWNTITYSKLTGT